MYHLSLRHEWMKGTLVQQHGILDKTAGRMLSSSNAQCMHRDRNHCQRRGWDSWSLRTLITRKVGGCKTTFISPVLCQVTYHFSLPRSGVNLCTHFCWISWHMLVQSFIIPDLQWDCRRTANIQTRIKLHCNSTVIFSQYFHKIK